MLANLPPPPVREPAGAPTRVEAKAPRPRSPDPVVAQWTDEQGNLGARISLAPLSLNEERRQSGRQVSAQDGARAPTLADPVAKQALQGKKKEEEADVLAVARDMAEITIQAKEITPEEARMISTDYVRKRLSIRH